jgi:hypothetical protein
VGFAGRAEEHYVVLGGDEVQGAQVRDDLSLEPAGVVEVELLQRFAGREPGGADPALAAVGGDLPLRATGNSSCARGSARARSASRSTDSRSVGAFSAQVRNATPAAMSWAAGLLAGIS